MDLIYIHGCILTGETLSSIKVANDLLASSFIQKERRGWGKRVKRGNRVLASCKYQPGATSKL